MMDIMRFTSNKKSQSIIFTNFATIRKALEYNVLVLTTRHYNEQKMTVTGY